MTLQLLAGHKTRTSNRPRGQTRREASCLSPHDRICGCAQHRANRHNFLLAPVVGLLLMLPGSSWARPVNRILGLETSERGDTTMVLLRCSSRPAYTVILQERPYRLLVNLTHSRLQGPARLTEVSTGAVGQIATAQFSDQGRSTSRVTVGLKGPSNYTAKVQGTSLIITVTPKSSARKQVARSTAARGRGALASVTDVRFVDDTQEMRVEIVLADQGPVDHQVMPLSKGPLLILRGVRLPNVMERSLDTAAFDGPVSRVTSYMSDPRRGIAHIKVALKDPRTEHTLRQQGKALLWSFTKPAPAPAAASPSLPRPALAAGPAETTHSYKPLQVAAARNRPRGSAKIRTYTGRRIDLDFKDADIHNILRLLADVGSMNIVTSDKVEGRVTIRMRNVPWDQALDVILRAKGLGQVQEGNMIRVAPLSDLEKEREAEIARQKQLLLLKPLETRLVPISYADAQKILPKLQYTLSPRGKLTYDERTNMIIARDTSPNLDLMERLIRNLDTQTPQILIETRIVEARTNYSREVGIQWGGSGVASRGTGNPTGLVFPNQVGVAGGVYDPQGTSAGGLLLGQSATPNFAVDLPASVSSGSGGAIGLTLGSVSGNVNINLRLSAAESLGDIRIISAPRVTTLDNNEAQITSGVEIPYSQVSAQGVQTTFKEATLELRVKPHVTADGSIILTINVKRDEPDFVNTGPRGEPTIIKKLAKTQMLVKDGNTMVIGGIYTTRVGKLHRKVPWLAEIPILGYLFRYKKDSTDRTEVLVFITPRVLNRALSLPR